MKKKLPVIFIVLIFVVGIAIMSYPVVSSIINNIASRNQAQIYSETVKSITTDEEKELFDQAKRYNDSLNNNVIITDPFDEEAYEKIGASYDNAFNVDGNGLIGYVDIPKINVYLPIYHGTDEHVLSKGAGHLQNTSLPVGGTSTHAVISAHSAYPGETFFDYLTDMQEGDEFYIHVLNRTLKYEVDQIKVVLPENTEDYRIIPGGDYVTLLTCTPYSINTHRLLVRGVRVEYDDSQTQTLSTHLAEFNDEGIYFLGYKIEYWKAITAMIIFVALVVALVVFFLRRSKKKKKKTDILYYTDDKNNKEDDG